MNDRLDGKIAVVTGASRGLGSAIATKLARQGAHVIINYQKRTPLARRLVSRLEAEGYGAEAYQTDVTQPDQVERMFRTIFERHGRVDILVNNAGATRDEYFLMMKNQSWDALVDVHLNATFTCSKAVLRSMCAARRGVIANIGSGSALVPMPGQVNYSATKAGLIAFSRSLAREVADKGVRVVHVAPGFFKTDMTELLDVSFREETYRRTPLGRWGFPEELADVIAFLVSDDASYITGQLFPIDGGRGAVEAEYGIE